MPSHPDATLLLRRAQAGDGAAAEELLPLLYAEFHSIAATQMRREGRGHTLQPTALVHEAYLKLFGGAETDWNDRGHFFAVASRVIRQVLVDHARRRDAVRRGGAAQVVSLDPDHDVEHGDDADRDDVDMVALHEALERLESLNPRQARVVELRYFGGLGVDEVAGQLGVSPRTVKGDWKMARAWLRARIEE